MPEESSRRSVQQLKNSVGRAQFWCEDQHVAAFSRTEVCPTRDARSRRADVLEVCWASATDTVEGGSSNLIYYPLAHWQPVDHVAEE